MALVDMWSGTWGNVWGTDNAQPDEEGPRSYYSTKVEIYADTAFGTLMDVINARYEPSTLSEIRNHGAGSFKVSKRDPKILNNPNLLQFRNYVKIRHNDKVIGGFIIQTKKTVIIGAGEERDETWEISGEGPRSWVRDASVYPSKGLKTTSGETRYFNFSTERGSWYASSEWPYAHLGYLWNSAQNEGSKRHAPANWPDVKNARWMWADGDYYDPAGFCYFRHEFTVTGDPGQIITYAFFIAADDAAEVYVDGEQKAVIEAPGWHDTTRIELELYPGPHVIGIKALNIGPGGPGELMTALFSYGDPNTPTAAQVINHSGMTDTWRVNAYPASEPGWKIGDVLLTLLKEAKTRGVRFANNFSPTFSTDFDSAGQPWPDPIPWSFEVGATYEDVISAVEELGCDVWVDPDTLEMHAWNHRGKNLTTSIVFSAGHNLQGAEETGQAEIANTLMLRTPEGWAESTATDTTSITKYGRIETQMSTKLTAKGASSLVQELFKQKALPEVAATFDIIPVPGMIPYVDFNVGDTVYAPGEVPDFREARRVMSIAFTEDPETGRPLYAVEFDTLFKDRQTELEKWLSRISNSSAISGGFTNSNSLPSTVTTVPPGKPIGIIPDAPTGLIVSSIGRYLPDGTSSSDYGLTWNPVVSGTGVGDVVIESYEVWGRQLGNSESTRITTVFDTLAYLTGYHPGDEWFFKIRAITNSGGPGEFGAEVGLVAEAPQVPLPKPSTPVLSTGFGGVTIEWDGELGGNPAPPYVRYVRVERSPEGDGVWRSIGTLTNGAIQDRPPGGAGTTYDYRLVAVDTYANESEPSDIASITVQGVLSGDITGGLASNNLVENGSFENGMSSWKIITQPPGSTAVDIAGGISGARYLRMTRVVESGDDTELSLGQTQDTYIPVSSVGQYGYFVSAKARSGAGSITGAFTVRAYWYTSNKTTAASEPFSTAVDSANLTTTSAYFAGRVYPPSNARYMRVVLVSDKPETVIYTDDVVAREAITPNMLGQEILLAEHFSAGSVTTSALQANSVTAEILDAEAVRADNIQAGAIQVSHLSPSVGDSLDISSNASVNILINRTDELQDDLNGTNQTVEELTTYYSFGPDGAIIGQTDSAFKLSLKNDRIEILENGIVVSYWDSGQMVVGSFVGEEVVLGNHKLEKYTTGTVVRAI